MSGEENIENVEPCDLSTEIGLLKSRRGLAKAAVTRIITSVNKLMAVDSNLNEVKEHMVELDQLIQEFSNAHGVYVDRLTSDEERAEADEYWQKAIAPAYELCDIVGAWIAELEDQGNDKHNFVEHNHETVDLDDENNGHNNGYNEHDDENNGHDGHDDEHNGHNEHNDDNDGENDDANDGKGDDKYEESKEMDGVKNISNKEDESSLQERSLMEKTLQQNAALQAKVHAVKRQQALEMEAFELESQELEERMKLERQRVKLQLELLERRRVMEDEMQQMKAELAQLKMTTITKEDTPTDAATKVAKIDQRFTHSTPTVDVDKPKRDRKPPPPKYTPQSKLSDVNSTPQPWTPSALFVGNTPPPATLGDVLQQMMNDTRMHQQSLVDSLQRPTIELMTFDGDPLKYWPFVRAFTNAVDSKSDDDGCKLNTLMQYCTGKVKSLLQCCLVKPPKEGYKLAWELLEERFGNHDIISQAWIAKILDRPKIKDMQGLQTFADELRTCRETLLTMGYLNELETRRSLCQIVEKLPPYLHSRWLKIQ